MNILPVELLLLLLSRVRGNCQNGRGGSAEEVCFQKQTRVPRRHTFPQSRASSLTRGIVGTVLKKSPQRKKRLTITIGVTE